jgi:hypothetical protein
MHVAMTLGRVTPFVCIDVRLCKHGIHLPDIFVIDANAAPVQRKPAARNNLTDRYIKI